MIIILIFKDTSYICEAGLGLADSGKSEDNDMDIGKTVSDKCEDAVGLGDNFIFVIDGATGLNHRHIMKNYNTDAQWLALKTRDYLLKSLPDTSKTIQDILKECMGALRIEWEQAGGMTGAMDVPSEALSIIRIVEDNSKGSCKDSGKGIIEYFNIGDCGISMILDGSIFVIGEDKLVALDNLLLDKIQALRNESNWKLGVREIVNDMASKGEHHRVRMNQSDGYWIATVTEIDNWIKNARYGSVMIHTELDKLELDSIMACTDGFSQVIDFGVGNSLYDIHSIVEEYGIDVVKRNLYRLQEKDLELKEVKRYKLRDDTSVIFTKIGLR